MKSHELSGAKRPLGSVSVNRYRRRLETCPKANLAESGREFFLLFFRRAPATSMIQRRVENTRDHFWTILPVSKKIVRYTFKIFFNCQNNENLFVIGVTVLLKKKVYLKRKQSSKVYRKYFVKNDFLN